MREIGILMPLFSLPSDYGIGDMGEHASEWVNLLHKNNITIWQILPLNPVGYGNSPYQPYSSYAGDEIYLSLEELYQEGLLNKKPEPFMETADRVHYDAVRAYKEQYLREAYQNFKENQAYEAFISLEWVKPYAVYQALKKKNHGKCWNEWSESEKNWCQLQENLSEDLLQEMKYHMFLQYMFDCQWKKLKQEANQLGIRIMGDVPFYVGLDSADVWSGKEDFLLDQDGRPRFIAGVPPDYFSRTGQRWGNPIYDWDHMKQTGYQFWIHRIGYSQSLFDIIRIDHFRAFDTFWKIPASCDTAIEGEWIEAPGYEVLDTLYENIDHLTLVAEDLGMLRPEVEILKNHYHLKGMKIFVFSINADGKYAKDEGPDEENMIFYTGTHDNDTVREWYGNQSVAKQRKIRRFLKKKGLKNGSVQERLLQYILKSRAEYAILSMPDLLWLDREGHINTPGTVGSPNWEWKMKSMKDAEACFGRLHEKIRR